MDSSRYALQLARPAREARGRTRWWWYGCRVDREDIRYQLDQMQRAGIGGVEIQITYPLEAGEENLTYFSPAFFEILRFTADEVKKRDMTIDLTLGSSWPFGGPFVPFAKSAVTVYPCIMDIHGPTEFSYDFTNRITGEIVGCVLGRMEEGKMAPESVRDMSRLLETKYLFGWPWGTCLRTFSVPPGEHKLVVFIASQFRQHVLMPTRGAEGYVIDHHDREAARLFFERAGTPLAERLGRGTVQSFFCDSLEVFGHNWTNGIYEEFEKRRGYSIRPYIYALWGEVGDLTADIRYDFHRTLSELTVENFFREMTRWCHEVGSMSRIQAHGTWGDVLLAYGAADVPEGETFSPWDKFSVNIVHRRLASSAGHLYHRPIISNESFTWLRTPRFTETLEQIKIAADSIFVDGMNQIVNHGYSYTPREGEQWAFYASSHISHTNPWWEFYPHVGRYINRVCDFLRRGENVADLWIYLPQGDIWAECPLSDVHMCMKLEERLETRALDGLARRGYWFDFVNDDVLNRWREYEGRPLVILETDRMPLDTARQVRAFAEAGHAVVCAERTPSLGCGMADRDSPGETVADIFRDMRERGLLTLAGDKYEALGRVLERLAPPQVSVAGEGEGPDPREDIGYVHRRDGVVEIYFTANMSLREHRARLRFRGVDKPCCVLDPMSAKEVWPEGCRTENGDTLLALRFRPGQSLLVIFDPALPPVRTERGERRTTARREMGRWRLTVEEKSFSAELERLEGFEKIPALRHYSGQAVYRTAVSVTAEELARGGVRLAVQDVGCAAAVYVNGRHAGDWIQRPYEMDLDGLLRAGENELEIRVSNLLINRVLDPEWKIMEYPETILPTWPYFPDALNKERRKRLSNWRELAEAPDVFPSGLIGDAWLEFTENQDGT